MRLGSVRQSLTPAVTFSSTARAFFCGCVKPWVQSHQRLNSVYKTHAPCPPKPLNADDIVETLEVARSNVSTSLKELQGWGIVRLVHVLGDSAITSRA